MGVGFLPVSNIFSACVRGYIIPSVFYLVFMIQLLIKMMAFRLHFSLRSVKTVKIGKLGSGERSAFTSRPDKIFNAQEDPISNFRENKFPNVRRPTISQSDSMVGKSG